MTTTADKSTGGGAAVYCSWKTFKNTIMDGFAQGLPNVIDRSLFPGQSGGAQGQLMAGLKFLGLIEDSGEPTESLRRLTSQNEAKRKEALQQILSERYSDVFDVGLEGATMNQLADVMAASYKVSGETKDKAIRFFLSAAKYSEVALSPHLLAAKISSTRRRSTRSSSKASSRKVKSAAPTDDSQENPADPPTGDNSRTITLASGGSLSIVATVDFLKLSADDRAFVFRIIDQLNEYESNADQDSEADDDDYFE